MQHTFILETGLNFLTIQPRSGKVMATIEDKTKKAAVTLIMSPEEVGAIVKALYDAGAIAQVEDVPAKGQSIPQPIN